MNYFEQKEDDIIQALVDLGYDLKEVKLQCEGLIEETLNNISNDIKHQLILELYKQIPNFDSTLNNLSVDIGKVIINFEPKIKEIN